VTPLIHPVTSWRTPAPPRGTRAQDLLILASAPEWWRSCLDGPDGGGIGGSLVGGPAVATPLVLPPSKLAFVILPTAEA